MKRIILTAVCAALMGAGTGSMAEETCVGGTWITANSSSNADKGIDCGEDNMFCNGYTFCKSPDMNWWSAFTWCKANGMKLASFTEACPGKLRSVNNVTGACPNLQGVGFGWVWLNLASGNDRAYLVDLAKGAVTNGNRSDITYRAAICVSS